ncbi:MAG: hypothetical protein EBT24_12665 [Betaproteobacteria bacterium]|nr:hypothetical protein [Betaproteobacteria bacterium]
MRFQEFSESDTPINQTAAAIRSGIGSMIPQGLTDLFQRVSTSTKQGFDQVVKTYLSPGSKEGFVEVPVTPRLSSRGVEAMNLQRGLMALGYDVGPTEDDGIIGPRTKAGILKFQQDSKLPPTGIPYKDTVAALNATLASKPQILGQLEKSRPEEYKGKISTSHLGDKAGRELLTKEATSKGIKDKELAAFLAQCSHESGGFRYLSEVWGPSLAQRRYEGRKDLGNTEKGDGYKYRGRGYIQLTGRANYRRAGRALGLPLENRPDLVSTPDIAARVAVWYWQSDVAPNITNWDDTKAITKIVNGGYTGYQDRLARYAAFKQDLNLA